MGMAVLPYRWEPKRLLLPRFEVLSPRKAVSTLKTYIYYICFLMQGDLPLSTGCSLNQRFIHDVCSILPNVIRVTPNAI